MLSERLSNDLGNDQVVEVRLVPGEVYPPPDLAAVPTSTAPISSISVDSRCTLGVPILIVRIGCTRWYPEGASL
jgi:hypothetical protein